MEPDKKSQNDRTLISKPFYFKDFFHRAFLVPKFRTFFWQTFLKNFFGGNQTEEPFENLKPQYLPC